MNFKSTEVSFHSESAFYSFWIPGEVMRTVALSLEAEKPGLKSWLLSVWAVWFGILLHLSHQFPHAKSEDTLSVFLVKLLWGFHCRVTLGCASSMLNAQQVFTFNSIIIIIITIGNNLKFCLYHSKIVPFSCTINYTCIYALSLQTTCNFHASNNWILMFVAWWEYGNRKCISLLLQL